MTDHLPTFDQRTAKWFACRADAVLDVGAFCGGHSAEYLKHGAGSVYAFEPLAENRAAMPAALLSDPRFHLLPVALGAISGTTTLYVPARNRGASTVSRAFSDRYGDVTDERTVEIRTLDDLDLPPAQFWKIDAEGAELDILRGASRRLRQEPPCVIEVELFNHDRKHYIDVLNFLGRHFEYMWALGVSHRRNLVCHALTPDVIARPDFHRDLARARTPHYYASRYPFVHWSGLE